MNGCLLGWWRWFAESTSWTLSLKLISINQQTESFQIKSSNRTTQLIKTNWKANLNNELRLRLVLLTHLPVVSVELEQWYSCLIVASRREFYCDRKVLVLKLLAMSDERLTESDFLATLAGKPYLSYQWCQSPESCGTDSPKHGDYESAIGFAMQKCYRPSPESCLWLGTIWKKTLGKYYSFCHMRSPSKSAPVVIKILGYAYKIFVLQNRLQIRNPHAWDCQSRNFQVMSMISSWDRVGWPKWAWRPDSACVWLIRKVWLVY
jgi:hypothetical protein